MFVFSIYSSDMDIKDITKGELVNESVNLSETKFDVCSVCNKDIHTHIKVDGFDVVYKARPNSIYVIPKCGHKFHLSCIKKILKKINQCPVKGCKCKIEPSVVFKYFGISPRVIFGGMDPNILKTIYILLATAPVIIKMGISLAELNNSNDLSSEENKKIEEEMATKCSELIKNVELLKDVGLKRSKRIDRLERKFDRILWHMIDHPIPQPLGVVAPIESAYNSDRE